VEEIRPESGRLKGLGLGLAEEQVQHAWGRAGALGSEQASPQVGGVKVRNWGKVGC
jgi:hypothetical protein